MPNRTEFAALLGARELTELRRLEDFRVDGLSVLPDQPVPVIGPPTVVQPPRYGDIIVKIPHIPTRIPTDDEGDDPSYDFRGKSTIYTLDGKQYTWPKTRIARRLGPTGLRIPDLQFVRSANGVHLIGTLEEDVDNRPRHLLPLPIEAASLTLEYGINLRQSVRCKLDDALASDPSLGPSFRVSFRYDFGSPDIRDRVLSSLQGEGGRSARWKLTLRVPAEWAMQYAAANASSNTNTDTNTNTNRLPTVPTLDPAMIRAIREARLRPVAVTRPHRLTPATPDVATLENLATHDLERLGQAAELLERRESEWEIGAYFRADTPENQSVYAAITGNLSALIAQWQEGPNGLFQVTSLRQTIYIVPDAFRLALDSESGLPAITAVLLPPAADDAAKGPRTRLTFHVRPWIDPARLERMRAFFRSQSEGTVPYAEFVLGGVSGATFVPDPSLAGLGELFSGSGPDDATPISPSTGFAITYEGDAEYIAEIYARLKADREYAAIRGHVQLSLLQPDQSTRAHRVPVELRMAAVLPAELPATVAVGDDGIKLVVRNPMPVSVQVKPISVHAVALHVYTQEIAAAQPVVLEESGSPVTIGAEGDLEFSLPLPESPYNSLKVAPVLGDPELGADILLDRVFDTTPGRVDAWSLEVTFLPFAYWDQLTEDERATVGALVAVEIEVRRPGSERLLAIKLDKATPRAGLQLSLTVRDYLDGESSWKYSYRRRDLRPLGPGDWGDWTEGFGASLALGLHA